MVMGEPGKSTPSSSRLELELEGMLAVADPGVLQIPAEESRASAAGLPIVDTDHERNGPVGRRLVLGPALQLGRSSP